MLARLAGDEHAPPTLLKRYDVWQHWAHAYAEDLATRVGGGRIGAGPLADIRSAACREAWSEEFTAHAAEALTEGDRETAAKLADLAMRLGDSARLSRAAAHQAAARQAAVTQSNDPLGILEQGGTDADPGGGSEGLGGSSNLERP